MYASFDEDEVQRPDPATPANYHTLVKQKLEITSDIALALLAARLNLL
jgi:hypothetical protein